MHFLDAPCLTVAIIGLKSSREPVQQLWVSWRLACIAKVIWCRDNSGTKVPLPYSINHHACGQRIPLIGYPCSKGFPAVSVCRIRWNIKQCRKGTDRGNGSRIDLLLRRVDIPTGEEKCRSGFCRCSCVDTVGADGACLIPCSGGKHVVERLPHCSKLSLVAIGAHCNCWFHQ